MSQKSFQCQMCGHCCSVPGYVEITEKEADAIAEFLHLDIFTFTEKYTELRLCRTGLSLISRPDNRCIFLQEDNTCQIQPVKPAQCQAFPFGWNEPQLLEKCHAWKAMHEE